MASPKKHLKNTGCRPKNKESYILWAKTLSNLLYLHFHLLCLAGRGLDVLVPPQEEDVLAPKQLLQLQPLLNLLPQDLENVRGGCGARAHVPEVFNSIKNHIAGTKYCQYWLSIYLQEECWQCVLPASESPWSTFPRFIRLLGRAAAHQQVLARAERVAQVGKSGIWVPRILQQREYQGVARERVLIMFERAERDKAAEREFNFGQSLLEHIWVPACVPGRSLWRFLQHTESPIPVISAARQGNKALELFVAAACVRAWTQGMPRWNGVLWYRVLLYGVQWYGRVLFACWHARVIKEWNTPRSP